MKTRRQQSFNSGFTLLEMMVATVISLIVIMTLLAMLNHTSKVYMSSRSTNEAFQTASDAFDTLATSLSQAVLQTYWSYDNPSLPQKYVRASELHFILERTNTLLNMAPDAAKTYPGSGVFFQAALGTARNTYANQLPSRLNATGFFTAFGAEPNTPDLLKFVVQRKYRFRLFEWREPTDDLRVYKAPGGTDWFKQPLGTNIQEAPGVSQLGENVIGVFIIAEYPGENGAWTQNFLYDSRDTSSAMTLNQLPPQLQVALVAIDEPSASRLATLYDSTPPPIAPPEDTFKDPAKFGEDLAKWEKALREDNHINCRVFRTTISIPNSRWSTK